MNDAQRLQAEALAKDELAQLREELRRSAGALISLESERAIDLEARWEAEREVERLRREHEEAHRTIQAMQRTRVWRLGSMYWRVRAGILRRP
jgi:hypothetical protein